MADQEITIKVSGAPRESGSAIPQGVFARLGAGVQAGVNAFFGPGEALPAQAPPGTPVRAMDYSFGVNMTQQPQADALSRHDLRRMAESYPLLRLAIEHMKDRICSKSWSIRLIKDPDETAAEHAARSLGDPRIAALTKLFKRPDLENSWRTWLRKLLEDYYVIDAASIYVQRVRKGGIYRLLIVDGATIVRKIDEQGMTPMGPTDVAYQQLVKGIPAIDLAKRDLLYCADNIRPDRMYGYSRVEQVIQWVVLGMNRLLHQTNYYTEGSVPDVFAFLEQGTTPEAAEKWDAVFQKIMAGNSAAKRRVWWMPGGQGVHAPVQMKKEDLTDKMDEMLNRFICAAFGMTPSALVPQVNRAAAGQMADDADEAGETPVTAWVEDKMNEIIQSEQYGNLPGYEFAFETATEVDVLIQAEIDQVYYAMANDSGNGLEVYNEMRERDGKEHLEDNTPPPPTLGPGGAGGSPVDPDIDSTAPTPPPKAKRLKMLTGPKTAKGTVLTIDPGEESPAKAKVRKAIAGEVSSFLAKQPAAIAKQVATAYVRQKAAHGIRRKSSGGKPDRTDGEIEDIADEVMSGIALDWSELIDQVEPLLQQAAALGTTRAGTQLDAAHDIFAQANEWAIEYAQERAAELVGMKYVGGKLVTNPNPVWAITETTRGKLREIVVKALQNGDAPATLKATIRDSAQFSEQRAEMIATTETNFANSNGQFEVAKLVGHTHKRSILSGDHDIDDDCDDNAAAADLEILELFPDGSEFSPFHPLCVCLTQTYEKDEEL